MVTYWMNLTTMILRLKKTTGLIVAPDHRISKLSQLLEIFPDLHQSEPSPAPAVPDYLYDVSISTMWGIDQPMPFEETFETARSIGIARFELNHRVTDHVFEQFNHNRHYVGSVHDPCRSALSFDEQKKQDLDHFIA